MKSNPDTIGNKKQEIIEEFRKNWLEIRAGNPAFNWRTLEQDIENFISQSLDSYSQQAVKEERERVRKAFIKKYKGAGEVFFPYVSENNCTVEEEQEYIEQEWKDILSCLEDKEEK